MSLKNQLSWFLRSNPALAGTVYRPLRWVYSRTAGRKAAREFQALWEQRHHDVLGCPDNDHIPRVADAGAVRDGSQVMHNGVRVRVGSYYGSEVTKMLERNRGVHEPQEERVFGAVLKEMPQRPTMIELGAYWGFYSLWFLKECPDGRAILVEPETENLKMGRGNFELNRARGDFIQAFVGSEPATSAVGQRTVCVDELVEQFKIERLNILHADIQGHEMHMLDGAKRTLDRGLVDYIFISTHSPELHAACRDRLRAHGFEIIADADMQNTYSLDGLLAGRHQRLAEPVQVVISLKTRDGVRPAGR